MGGANESLKAKHYAAIVVTYETLVSSLSLVPFQELNVERTECSSAAAETLGRLQLSSNAGRQLGT